MMTMEQQISQLRSENDALRQMLGTRVCHQCSQKSSGTKQDHRQEQNFEAEEEKHETASDQLSAAQFLQTQRVSIVDTDQMEMTT